MLLGVGLAATVAVTAFVARIAQRALTDEVDAEAAEDTDDD